MVTNAYLQVQQVGASEKFGEKVFIQVGFFFRFSFPLEHCSAIARSTAHHGPFLRSRLFDDRNDFSNGVLELSQSILVSK